MPGQPRFETTCWTVVNQAGTASEAGRAALAELCERYWRPLYGYVRRRGHSSEEAQDIVQDFFARFLEGNRFALADAERGRFRTFLLRSMDHFLANVYRKATRLKRGAGRGTLPFDTTDAGSCDAVELDPQLDAEAYYDYQWAMELVGRVTQRLEQYYTQKGRTERYQHLRALSPEPTRADYEVAGQALGMSPDAVKVANSRVRRKLAEFLRDEVRDTVTDADAVEAELRKVTGSLDLSNAPAPSPSGS